MNQSKLQKHDKDLKNLLLKSLADGGKKEKEKEKAHHFEPNMELYSICW